MRVVVIIPPEAALTLAETKQHLRVDGDDDDALIAGMMAAAQGHIEGPDGWLGRAVGVQTIEARFDDFGCGSLRLPYPPVIDIVSVGYVPEGGGTAVIEPAAYELRGASLMPVFGGAWPTPRWEREAVRVRYRAGYEAVPAPIRAALLLMVGDLYKSRETFVAGSAAVVPMSTTVDALLGPYRVFA